MALVIEHLQTLAAAVAITWGLMAAWTMFGGRI
jgi:hypothetical protein